MSSANLPFDPAGRSKHVTTTIVSEMLIHVLDASNKMPNERMLNATSGRRVQASSLLFDCCAAACLAVAAITARHRYDDYYYRIPAVSPLPSSPLYAMCYGLAVVGTAVSAVTMSKQRGGDEA